MLVKDLFGGVLSNNVMSMECPHFSTRPEEFYTVRCQVADMKTLYVCILESCKSVEGVCMKVCPRFRKV